MKHIKFIQVLTSIILLTMLITISACSTTANGEYTSNTDVISNEVVNPASEAAEDVPNETQKIPYERLTAPDALVTYFPDDAYIYSVSEKQDGIAFYTGLSIEQIELFYKELCEKKGFTNAVGKDIPVNENGFYSGMLIAESADKNISMIVVRTNDTTTDKTIVSLNVETIK